jgi:N-acetylglucosamine malate deacetylase 2
VLSADGCALARITLISMEQLRPLLDATLVVVAHPDDEVIACGTLMQRMQQAAVVFATDGAPREEGFWKQYGSREAYSEIRRREARHALKIAGACPIFLADRVKDGIADQELFKSLDAAIAGLESIVVKMGPAALLTLAYEGGHPDHDAACFIAHVVGRRAALPVWECPLYHRNADGSNAFQVFPTRTGGEVELHSECPQLQKKIKMFHAYESQRPALESFRSDYETFRPIADYDFTRPPLPWKLNYEMWGWQMSGAEVAGAFADYLQAESMG